MIIIGIDPGPEKSAIAVYEPKVRSVIGAYEWHNPEVLVWLRGAANVAKLSDMLVIERVASYGMPVGASVFETVYWTGRFVQVWFERVFSPETEVDRLTFSQVRQILCHSNNAKESHVRRAVLDLVGEPGTKKKKGPTYGVHGHAWSALAIAVAWSVANGHN